MRMHILSGHHVILSRNTDMSSPVAVIFGSLSDLYASYDFSVALLHASTRLIGEAFISQDIRHVRANEGLLCESCHYVDAMPRRLGVLGLLNSCMLQVWMLQGLDTVSAARGRVFTL